MEIYETESEIAKRKNWLLSLVVIVLVTFGILVLLQGIALAIAPALFNITLNEIMGLMAGDFSPPNGRMAMYFVQGLGSGIGFIVASLVIIKLIDRSNLKWGLQWSRFNLKNAAIVIALTFGGMFFNAFLVHLNSQMVMPEFLSELEVWMKGMEDQLMRLTKFLTDFQSVPELLMGILVIGIFAGIGEELFFRGLIQPKMQLYTGNAHAGIWLTAFIFSAIHFQFYGFLPRLFLGGLFGYLYYYSGSLTYPILAHIVNNSFTLLMAYFANEGIFEFDMEDTDTVSYPLVFAGLLVLTIGIFYFKKINKPNEQLDQSI